MQKLEETLYGTGAANLRLVYGKKIKQTAFDKKNERLVIDLVNGVRVELWDGGQSCCESRYMTADDEDLSYYSGAKLLGFLVEDAPAVEGEYDVHEVQFLHVKTSKGSFTLASHNEHNGYYGGISLSVKTTVLL